jgi:type III restriction enzyme
VRTTIQNPILNSPFLEPARHFRINDDGITDKTLPGRRPSSFLIPIPPPRKKKGAAVATLPGLDLGLREERQEAKHINTLRDRVRVWRDSGYRSTLPISPRTRMLLEHWFSPQRDPQRRLFFAQREAIETLIFLHAVAQRGGSSERALLAGILDDSKRFNDGLLRLAVRMATGTGKTAVMALVIAWMTLNHAAATDAERKHFARNFLVVAPGITIRDRLQVLRPESPDNLYQRFDLVPEELMGELRDARVEIVNYHGLRTRTHTEVSKAAKTLLLDDGVESPFEESLAQMVARVSRSFDDKGGVVVLNDEAHHCYRPPPPEQKDATEGLTADDKRDAKRDNEKAGLWFRGLRAFAEHRTVTAIYDFSATPQYLRGSGHAEGTLFPWVVSDFPLVEAIEAGIVKVPAVPVDDDRVSSDTPDDRALWEVTREWWKSNALYEAGTGRPQLPPEVEFALERLVGVYSTAFEAWRTAAAKADGFIAPPVFIVVCQTTKHSKLLYDFLAGYRRADGVWMPGKFPVFSNVDERGAALARPNAILVDSEQLESGEALSKDFLDAAKGEIDAFTREYRRRHGAAAAEKITEADLLREVLNTVGRKGRLGEQVRCVVSVSMLTEGWDANTVTHVFGLRAFSSQLLCEQVVGRGLRRMDFTLDSEDHYRPEKVDVYGVPFQFVPCAPIGAERKAPTEWYDVKNDPARVAANPALRVTFPRVAGYRHRMPDERLGARFTEESRLVLTTQDFASQTEVATLMGDGRIHELERLRALREQTVVYTVADALLQRYFVVERDADDEAGDPIKKVWLFPQLVDIVRRWVAVCVRPHMKDGTCLGMLTVGGYARRAAERVYHAIVTAHGDTHGPTEVLPLLASPERGSTDAVDFVTTRPRYSTDPAKCAVTHVVADTEAWEQKAAQAIEGMDEVRAYVKNDHLGLTIPYVVDGVERRYLPDFVVKFDDGGGLDDLLHVLVEVTGQKRPDKVVKVATARDVWVPAVNHTKRFGRWAFVEVRDVANTASEIREGLHQGEARAQENLLADIDRVAKGGRVDKALDRLFLFVDDRLLAGRFADVDALLARADPAALHGSLQVGMLTITAAARDELSQRADFVRRVRASLALEITDRAALEETLMGLD